MYLRDIWPSQQEIREVIASCLRPEMFTASTPQVFAGDDQWRSLPSRRGALYAWDPESTYVREPPYFDELAPEPRRSPTSTGARVLALLGDSVTTDHISPAGAIKADCPGRPVPDRARRAAAGTSTPTAPAAATTR